MSAQFQKIKAPEMVFIKGEEMTRVVMDMVLDQWVKPYMDTSAWQEFDLSVSNRDATNDQVLRNAIEAGKKAKAIFKEPTITPTADQQKEMGLQHTLGSPNGAMRRGWNGFTISRDTITVPDLNIPGFHFGYESPVLLDRHAVGGEYDARHKVVGPGRAVTTFYPEDGGEPVEVANMQLADKTNALVTYTNPYDNVADLAEHFFARALATKAKPFVVTKKTVFKWQEPFWQIMKAVYDAKWKDKFEAAGIGGELQHLLSDDAAMKSEKWKKGGFAFVCHNYDGDWLSDEIAECHGSPALLSSVLCGKAEDGSIIKEFEASHGTAHDLYLAHLKGQPTSFNPIGMVDALIGAINHSAEISKSADSERIRTLTDVIREAMYDTMRAGTVTRDIDSQNGVNTEEFIASVADRIRQAVQQTQLAEETHVSIVQTVIAA